MTPHTYTSNLKHMWTLLALALVWYAGVVLMGFVCALTWGGFKLGWSWGALLTLT